MSGIDDLDFEDLVDGAINTIDDVQTQKIAAQKLFSPKARKSTQTPILSGKEMAATANAGHRPDLDETARIPAAAAPLAAPARKPPEAPLEGGPRANFEQIYHRGGVPAGPFTVFRLEELMNDPELASLDQSARVVAVRAVLRSHDVDVDHVVADAVARTAALDAHDDRIRGQIERVEREMFDENARIQQEIEEFANPRIAKIEKNTARVERLREEYESWTTRKAAEADRIAAILEPWGGDDRLRSTHRVTVPEPVTAPTLVSGDEAFEGEVEPPREVAQDVLAAAQADQWAFDEEPIEAGPAPAAAAARPAPADTTFDGDAVAATGELDFTPPRVRVPETIPQGLVAAFALLVWVGGGLLLAAQLTMIVAPAAVGVALGGPVVLAFGVALATRRSNSYWTGFFAMLLLFGLVGVVVAHALGPAALVKNLTTRPIWFVHELGLSADVEAQVHHATSRYAEAVGPILGVTPAQGE